MNYATTQGTARFSSKRIEEGLPTGAYRKLGRTGWTVSSLGFGGYRIDLQHPQHRQALEEAIRRGCNLIDTSTNYGDGESEALVGDVLTRLVENGTVAHDEIVTVSKVGYVQGRNLAIARDREDAGAAYAEMVKYAENCWHCIHPDFLSDGLTASLERLRLDRIDVYLLHNPEYFFSDAESRGDVTPLPKLRDAFYARIARAFERLEEEVERGRITCYGVSSNMLGAPASAYEAVSLSRLVEVARKVAEKRGGDPNGHRFSVVQMPLNLFESGPALERNCGIDGGSTALEFAEQSDLGVLVNRPLNAFFNGQLFRLAESEVRKDLGTISDELGKVAELEAEFATNLAARVEMGKDSVPASELFRWGRELANPQLTAISREQWNQIEEQMVRPQIRYLIEQLDTHFDAETATSWREWRDRYLPALERSLATIANECVKRGQSTVSRLSQRLDHFLPDALADIPLSRKVLAVLANTPGVSCVLNGMRQPAYVLDSLRVLELDAFDVKAALYQSFLGAK